MTNNYLKKSIFVRLNKENISHDLNDKTYNLDENTIQALTQLDGQPISKKKFLNQLLFNDSNERLDFLIKEGVLVPAYIDEMDMFYPRKIDIETVRHCNSRCVYCPQSTRPKSENIMSLEIFSAIMSRLHCFDTNWIAINHYGEPLLDPYFKERIQLINEGHSLFLATNGVLLTKEIIEFLSNMSLHTISFNFPSINSKQWAAYMQIPERLFAKVRRAIELSISEFSDKANVNVVVHPITRNQRSRMREIKKYFSSFGEISVIKGFTRSRGGALNDVFVQSAHIKSSEVSCGCDRIVSHLHISWDGKCYLCCEDYFQRFSFGNLFESDIMSIMTSGTARKLRSEIYGQIPMRKDLICRNCAKLRKKNKFNLYCKR